LRAVLGFALLAAPWAYLGAVSVAFANGPSDGSYELPRGTRRFADGPRLLAQTWDQLTPDQRERARRNFEAYRRLPPDRQRDVDRRFDQWQHMGSGEKARVRRNYDSYRQMSPDQRRDFGRRYQLYKRERRP
jgi:hypothetical protein